MFDSSLPSDRSLRGAASAFVIGLEAITASKALFCEKATSNEGKFDDEGSQEYVTVAFLPLQLSWCNLDI
jgi:hypothetical protein